MKPLSPTRTAQRTATDTPKGSEFMPRPPKEWLNLLFSWHLRTMAFSYIGWGGFFLALAPHFPPNFAKDPFSNGFVWGGGFIFTGLMIINGLTHLETSRWRTFGVILLIAYPAVFLAVWFTILLGTANPLLSMILILWWPFCIEIINVKELISVNEENARSAFSSLLARLSGVEKSVAQIVKRTSRSRHTIQ